MRHPKKTAPLSMWLKSLRPAHLPLLPLVKISLSQSRSSKISHTHTLSPVPSVPNPSRSFPKKSAHTFTNKNLLTLLPRPSKLPSRRLLKSIWSLSANPDTTDMEDTDMEDTDTTTAKRLPPKSNTMFPLSLPLISPSPLPTPPPRRSVLTNPSPFPLLPALISLRKRPFKFPPLSILRLLLPTARLKLVSPPAKRLSSPSPNKSVSNLSTDTPMSPHQHPVTLLPLPLMLKQSTLKIALPPNDQVILCRSTVPDKECFQDYNYLSIFIITLFMPYKNAFHFLLTS